MLKKVLIENLKDIKKLEFIMPESKGVYLIAGANGCGKTTLLVCLDRICNNFAFAYGFSSTSQWEAADQYEDAQIIYSVGDDEVSYKKAPARWVPIPKRGSKILNNFGISDSAFIRADAQRIAVKQEDLKAGNLINADKEVKDALNKIFETGKYDKLYRLKTTNGRGRTAVYFYVIKESGRSEARYYSEKRFSTGELAMIRLVERVEHAQNGSMILLDEAELALHPRAQVNLLGYLKSKAEQNNLWVFISTHSPTMIKETDKEHILLLKKENEETKVISPCYPACAVGEVDFTKAFGYDYIFFVEDEKAVEILSKIVERYKKIKTIHITATVAVIPVGGFKETAKLAARTSIRLLNKSIVRAVLDKDFEEALEVDREFKKFYKDNENQIKSLPFTPEVWLIDKLKKADASLEKKIKEEYHYELNDILSNEGFTKCNSPKPRQLAKDQYNAVINMLSNLKCRDKEKIDSDLIDYVIDNLSDGEIQGVAGPLFS